MGRSDVTHRPCGGQRPCRCLRCCLGPGGALTTAANSALVQDAISGAVLDMAGAGQLDPTRLRAYALDRAHVALAGS